MERLTVYFQLNGKDESQSGEYNVSPDGDPLRYKPIIDTAIEIWRVAHKTAIKSPVTNIRVFNQAGKLIAEQTDWTDFNEIVEISK